MSTEM
jgi:hypothetical protein